MDIVNFEIAKKLKEKGFSLEKTEIYGKFDSDGLFHSQLYFNYFETMDCDEIIAPTISQVLKWLREEKKISIEPGIHWTLKWMCGIYGLNDDISDFTQRDNDGFILYDSYEQAALAGIEHVLDNVI